MNIVRDSLRALRPASVLVPCLAMAGAVALTLSDAHAQTDRTDDGDGATASGPDAATELAPISIEARAASELGQTGYPMPAYAGGQVATGGGLGLLGSRKTLRDERDDACRQLGLVLDDLGRAHG